jgi:hypothetical protein
MTLHLFRSDGYEAHRHVCKHVLRSEEGWAMLLPGGIDLKGVHRLQEFGCYQESHGPACPNYPDCHKILSDLSSHYTEIVEQVALWAAAHPLHAHHLIERILPNGRLLRREGNFFLSEKGVLVEVAEFPDRKFRVRRAYRRSTTGMPLEGDEEYLREAKEYIRNTRIGFIRRFCIPETWWGLPGQVGKQN